MLEKHTNKVLVLFLLLALGIAMSACSNGVGIMKKNSPMEFEDFLIERCVREELRKDWDEEITYGEVADIKELVISNYYNPTILSDDIGLNYAGYIDLVDLEYFTNLEELTFSTYASFDTIANLDSITNCKKLKKLSVPCSLAKAGNRSMGILGFKYWTDIIKELPKLEYLDLGMYVDEHMKDVILSKSKNKDIEFVLGDELDDNEYGYMNEIYAASNGSGQDFIYIVSDASEYNDSWDYDFNGYTSMFYDLGRYDFSYGGYGGFPVLEGNAEEITNKLNKLDDDTEDIIIKYYGEEFDFSILKRFDNLVSLSIVGVSGSKMLHTSDGSVTYQGLKAQNLDVLEKFDYLQVLNLCGFQGDLSEISECEHLRELVLDNCNLDSTEFISELNNIKELTLGLFIMEDDNQYWEELGEEVCSLSNLKFYRDKNIVNENYDCYKDIDNMTSLETLFYHDSTGGLGSVLESKSIKNLCITGYNLEWEFSKKPTFKKMENLEVCYLRCHSIGFDYESLLDLPELKTAYLPNDVIKEDAVLTPEMAKKIVSHKNISAFVSNVEKEYALKFMRETDRDYIKELYDANITGGIGYFWLNKQWGQGEEKNTYNDFIEFADSQ